MGSKPTKACTHVLKRGPRQGEVCGRTPIDAQGHCSSCARNYVAPTTVTLRPRPTKRTTLPKKVREDVWLKYYGENFRGRCYCCQCELKITNFHCGHIKAAAQGGSDEVANLVPLCAGCNLSMGDTNLLVYMQRYYPGNLVTKKTN